MGGVTRVNGNLNLSRAIGDLRYKVCSHLFSIWFINQHRIFAKSLTKQQVAACLLCLHIGRTVI